MKNQVPTKLFKRKTSSLKSLQVDLKKQPSEFIDNTSKFLSPRNVKGLDSTMYKKEEAIVRTLQEEVNKLKKKVTKLQQQNTQLKDQNITLRQDNSSLKQQIEEHNERQKKSRNQHFATVDALNELKQKIDFLSQDQLSTADEINMEDVCNCHQYQGEVREMKAKIRFLQESLLHSHEIILRLQEEMKKIKVSKRDKPLNEMDVNGMNKSRKESVRQNVKRFFGMSLIEEVLEVNQE